MRQNVTTLNQGQQNSLSSYQQAIAYQHPQHINYLLDLLLNQLSPIAVGQGREIS
jgi:hypothetical protein